MFKQLFNRKQKKEQGMSLNWYANIFWSIVTMTAEERDAKYESIVDKDFTLGYKSFREVREISAYKGAFLAFALLQGVCETDEDAVKIYKTWVLDMAQNAYELQDKYLALI